MEKLLRWKGKVKWICRWSFKVSVGNEYLANFAKQYNPNVVVNPTTIDTTYLTVQIHLLVIADRPPQMKLRNLIFRKWSTQTEIADLMLIDIGIMPLPDDLWTRGKCGFKALQYLALEIPCLASPVR